MDFENERLQRIDKIILHCTNSDIRRHDREALKYLHIWHVEERNFSDIGYHYVISKTRGLELARPIERAGAHCLKHNRNSIGIAMCGKYHFTEYQFTVLEKLLYNLMCIFNLDVDAIYGHYELDDKKTCPNIEMDDVRGWYD